MTYEKLKKKGKQTTKTHCYVCVQRSTQKKKLCFCFSEKNKIVECEKKERQNFSLKNVIWWWLALPFKNGELWMYRICDEFWV